MPIKQMATVSVDIGHSSLKLIQTGADGRIQKFVVHRIPEGCVDDLNIVSEDALIKSLKTARQKARLNPGKCFLVLSGTDILIRHFTLPILSEDELYRNILNEMTGYLPVDPEKYYIDYKIVEKVKEDNAEMYNVLVTTVHKRIVNRYKSVLGKAGFRVTVVDTGVPHIVVFVDEAHRTQYGFKARVVEEKDEQGKVIGNKVVYGLAKYLRDALPNATYIGFTGTPIEKEDRNTPAVFGGYVDIYDIAQAQEDGATVKIYYESRFANIGLTEEVKKLINELD